MDNITLAKRIQTRRFAEECWATTQDQSAFLERIMELGGLKSTKLKPDIVPMTEKEVHEFRRRRMPWGIHKDERIGDISVQYIAHVLDPSPSAEEFKLLLQRYLKSSYCQSQHLNTEDPTE